MRNLLLLFTLSFVCFMGYSQNTFKMIFTGPGYDNGIAAFRTSDKGYLIVGNTASYGHGGSDVWVIAMDSNANFLWQKTYGGSNNEEATKAIITSSDELIITGNSTSTSSYTVNVFVMRLSKTGVPAFFKTYGNQDWDFSNSLTMQNDSTILVCGKTFNGPHSGYYDPFVMALKTNGDSLWTQYTGSSEEDNRDIIVDENQNIYIAGSSLLATHTIDTAFIKRLDSVGNMQWQSYLSNNTRSQFLSLTRTNDSNITATGYQMDTGATFREPIFAKIDRAGNWIWYRNAHQPSDSYFSSIEEEPSGKLVISGMSTTFSVGGVDMYNSTFSSDGWFFDGNICGGLKDDYSVMNSFYDFDSTYLAVGTTKSFHVPLSGILLVQMNADMNYDTTTRMVIVSGINSTETQPVIVDIYPNPSIDFIHLKFVSPINDKGILRVYNMEGKEVLMQNYNISSNEIDMDISTLSSGIYMLHLESKSINFSTKIIKN